MPVKGSLKKGRESDSDDVEFFPMGQFGAVCQFGGSQFVGYPISVISNTVPPWIGDFGGDLAIDLGESRANNNQPFPSCSQLGPAYSPILVDILVHYQDNINYTTTLYRSIAFFYIEKLTIIAPSYFWDSCGAVFATFRSIVEYRM